MAQKSEISDNFNWLDKSFISQFDYTIFFYKRKEGCIIILLKKVNVTFYILFLKLAFSL